MEGGGGEERGECGREKEGEKGRGGKKKFQPCEVGGRRREGGIREEEEIAIKKRERDSEEANTLKAGSRKKRSKEGEKER